MIMRKLFNSLFVVIAAMIAFAACVKEENAPADMTKTVQFIAESIETKTAFGTPNGNVYPTLWTDNDVAVKLSLNYNSPKDAEVEVSDDYKTARFDAEITDDNTGSYVFYAMSPASAYNSFQGSNKYLSANILTAQKSLENSVDEAAQVLYAVSDSFNEFPESVSLNFKHFTAYGRLSLVNLDLGDAVVSSVAITSDKEIAGRWNYYVETGTYGVNSGSNSITVETSDTDNVWFACAPVDGSGTNMKITVNTDKGRIVREISFAGNFSFKPGVISPFGVDMEGCSFQEPVIYELVTDPSELTPESKIIIVAAESEVAISTTQNGNNRAPAAVTKNEGNTISDPGDGVQIITVENGNKSGTVAFNVGNGYLYAAASDSNHLKTEETLSDNSSWQVTITETGIATIKAQGTNTRNWLRYNGGNKIFSCYGSGQKDVSIYKLRGSGIVLKDYLQVTPQSIEVDADATSATFTVSSDLEWNATALSGATATKDGNTVKVTFPANESSDPKSYTVTVSATGAESQTVTITQAGVVKKSTISDVIGMSTGTSLVTEGLVMAKYSRGVMIGDDTGVILVYNASGVSAEIGDKVSVSGTKGEYGGIGQINSPVVKVNSSKNTITYPNVTVVDGATLDTYTSKTEVEYIQYTGTLSVSGTYYNVNVDGAQTAVGSLQYPLSFFGLSGMDGKKIIVTGYFVGVSSSKYVNTMITAVELVENGGGTPDQDGDIYSLYTGELVEGDYVIVYNGGAMKAEVSSNRLGYSDVTVTDNKISVSDSKIVWHVAKSGDYWTVKNGLGYAAGTGVANKAQLLSAGTDDQALWTVSGSESYDFVNKANESARVNKTLRRNGEYGFACYSEKTGGSLSLYKKN